MQYYSIDTRVRNTTLCCSLISLFSFSIIVSRITRSSFPEVEINN